MGEGAREGWTGTGALVLGKLKNSLPGTASLRVHASSASFSQLIAGCRTSRWNYWGNHVVLKTAEVP